jgi:EAL domain-containing protein (putative c-di-GMP-specific phosphodiesterase class I)/GGDEF domain-containing protein
MTNPPGPKAPPTGDIFALSWLNPPDSPPGKATAALMLGVLLMGSLWAVLISGGTRYAFAHVFYLPILLSTAVFGVSGGVIAGLAGGLLLGPWVPLDTATGQAQNPFTWIGRLISFTAVGAFAGLLMRTIKRHQDHLRWVALHSLATGLPSRPALLRAIELIRTKPGLGTGIGKGSRREAPSTSDHSVLLVRANNYDQIISALGAQVGDRVIAALAKRISDVQGGTTVVYDLRDQTVGMIVPNAAELLRPYVADAQLMPARPLEVDGIPIYVDVAVGTATIDASAESADDVVSQATVALIEATVARRFHSHYTTTGASTRRKNLELLAQLPRAIDRRELFLEYQPKVDLRSGRTVGAEALVRWKHPTLGRVPPADFIPLAESTTLIHPLTRMVFRDALGHCAKLRAAGLELSIAVNLSARNLGDPTLFDDLATMVEEMQLPANRIELEITESAVLIDDAKVFDGLTALRARGMKVSIDDFGTGYTSLNHLAKLPIDGIKIDQGFVRGLAHDRKVRSIVKAMIGMTKELGLFTVAEGIEDQETAEELARLGCDVGQGYLFSRPLAAADLSAWVLARSEAPEAFAFGCAAQRAPCNSAA